MKVNRYTDSCIACPNSDLLSSSPRPHSSSTALGSAAPLTCMNEALVKDMHVLARFVSYPFLFQDIPIQPSFIFSGFKSSLTFWKPLPGWLSSPWKGFRPSKPSHLMRINYMHKSRHRLFYRKSMIFASIQPHFFFLGPRISSFSSQIPHFLCTNPIHYRHFRLFPLQFSSVAQKMFT